MAVPTIGPFHDDQCHSFARRFICVICHIPPERAPGSHDVAPLTAYRLCGFFNMRHLAYGQGYGHRRLTCRCQTPDPLNGL